MKRVLERQAARVLTGARRGRPCRPFKSGRRFDAADVQPGLFWYEDLREAPPPQHLVLRPQYCAGLLMATLGLCKALNQEYQGQPAWRTRFS